MFLHIFAVSDSGMIYQVFEKTGERTEAEKNLRKTLYVYFDYIPNVRTEESAEEKEEYIQRSIQKAINSVECYKLINMDELESGEAIGIKKDNGHFLDLTIIFG